MRPNVTIIPKITGVGFRKPVSPCIAFPRQPRAHALARLARHDPTSPQVIGSTHYLPSSSPVASDAPLLLRLLSAFAAIGSYADEAVLQTVFDAQRLDAPISCSSAVRRCMRSAPATLACARSTVPVSANSENSFGGVSANHP